MDACVTTTIQNLYVPLRQGSRVACFERGEIPAVWREDIVPIPKKTEKVVPDPNGYRGISLLSAVYKVFCTVLRMRLESYLEGNQLLCEEQNGFHKERSCIIDNIMMLTMIGRKIIKKKGSVFGGFIDLKKAYDSVNRFALWNKLRSLSIGGKIFDSIQAIYSDLKCKVKVGDTCSDSFPVDVGLRQGFVLSPILFSVYVNDLME